MKQIIVRRSEEQIKFNRLISILVWAKQKTGKSSNEIVSLLLRKGRNELYGY